MEGALSADTSSLRDMLRWTSQWTIPAGGFGRFAVKAQTTISGRSVSLSALNIELDGNIGEGGLTLWAARVARCCRERSRPMHSISRLYLSAFRPFTNNEWSRQPITLGGLTASTST